MKRITNTQMEKYVMLFLVVTMTIALASCTSNTKESNLDTKTVDKNGYQLSETQFTSSAMKLGGMEIQPFHEIVKAKGMFDVPPENSASISAYFGGTVKNIQLLPGERVQKGQVLFILENPEYVQLQQDYLEAKGQLAYLKSDFERQKNLVQDNVTSQKNYLKAESEYTVMRVKLESLSKKLTLMNINANALTLENIRTTVSVTSPINGFVTQVNITRGAFLNPSQVAISIVDTDHLHVELNIFERDLSKVRVGQPIQFKIQDDNRNEYQATVYLINKVVDPENRTIGIHGHLSDEKLAERFNPGMYVEADIYTSSESRASLPVDAMVEVAGKYYVLILNDSTKDGYSFVKKEIKIGASNTRYVEVLNSKDFNDKTEFLIKGVFNLITE